MFIHAAAIPGQSVMNDAMVLKALYKESDDGRRDVSQIFRFNYAPIGFKFPVRLT